MTTVLAHDDAPVAINSNTKRAAELSVAFALGAYCAHMGAITVPQHLHTTITAISHKDVPGTVKGKANRIRELAVTCALAADGAEMRAVRVPHNLNSVVALVADDEVALGVKRAASASAAEQAQEPSPRGRHAAHSIDCDRDAAAVAAA